MTACPSPETRPGYAHLRNFSTSFPPSSTHSAHGKWWIALISRHNVEPATSSNSRHSASCVSSGVSNSAACNAPHSPPGALPPPQAANSPHRSAAPLPAATDWAQLWVLGIASNISRDLFISVNLPGEIPQIKTAGNRQRGQRRRIAVSHTPDNVVRQWRSSKDCCICSDRYW